MQIKNNKFFVIFSVALVIAAGAFAFELKKGEDSAPVQSASPQSPAPTPANPAPKESKSVILDVPFFSQAPNANWSDPRQQDGCEEASLLMAWLWVNNNKSFTKLQAENEVIAMSEFEKQQYGNYLDLNAQDTVQLMKDYYKYDKVAAKDNVTLDDIKNELRKGNLVLVPANGQKLGNPNFTGAGPLTHMLVVRGFDDNKKQIITNDPGTRNGNLYRYNYDVFYNAMVNYPSGHHESQEGRPKSMIVVQK